VLKGFFDKYFVTSWGTEPGIVVSLTCTKKAILNFYLSEKNKKWAMLPNDMPHK
jgi:hypothetical protein